MHHMKCLYLCQPGVMDRWMDRETGGSMRTWVSEDEEEGGRGGEREISTGFQEAKTDGCSRVRFTNVNNLWAV